VDVFWAEPAANDLSHIERFITQDNPAAATDVVLTIIATAEALLANHAHIGKPGRVYGTREFVVPQHSSYVIIYRVVANTLQIIRVLHVARQWPQSNQ
jgi:toxin ParE1/3/4